MGCRTESLSRCPRERRRGAVCCLKQIFPRTNTRTDKIKAICPSTTTPKICRATCAGSSWPCAQAKRARLGPPIEKECSHQVVRIRTNNGRGVFYYGEARLLQYSRRAREHLLGKSRLSQQSQSGDVGRVFRLAEFALRRVVVVDTHTHRLACDALLGAGFFACARAC